MSKHTINTLEEEAIYIIREVVGQFDRPVLLFSGGKDSITLVHLALKAFAPGKIPFPLLHIDTGHNFPETIAFRDKLAATYGLNIIVRYVQDSIDEGKVMEEVGPFASRNSLQTTTLLDAISEYRFDACIGGARRDEEKARAKERIFSVRNAFGEWNEKAQRPELFDMLNGRIHQGENVRVFPISNWTELDVWEYIRDENIEIPSLYFAHKRDVVLYKETLFPVSNFLQTPDNLPVTSEWVRFRTVGDMTCTAANLSNPTETNLDAVIDQISASSLSERGTRIDDQRSEGAMELRKKQGYF